MKIPSNVSALLQRTAGMARAVSEGCGRVMEATQSSSAIVDAFRARARDGDGASFTAHEVAELCLAYDRLTDATFRYVEHVTLFTNYSTAVHRAYGAALRDAVEQVRRLNRHNN